MFKPLTIFMLLKTTPAWLGLPVPARGAWVEDHLMPILDRHPGVSLRYFDAEAFSGRVTDVVMWQVADLRDYSLLIDDLRSCDFFAKPFFEVVDTITTLEDAWKDYHAAQGLVS